ncbi:hypothetical protein V1517DRAFT_340297 [Lipomyces orientalis]|uniref:Uncharacterized protein n=1 Tax=Lipomyces orientalis TaxID=1233043 RepID=A0ACC3TID4_9ASCO
MAVKSVLITGCSDGGIGSALALAFQKRGLHVFATARTISKMSRLDGLPCVTLVTLDVTNYASITSAVEIVKSATGGTLDYLVNNSGVGYVMPTLDVDIEEAKRVFDVNVWGLLAVTQAFAPLVIATNGSIVNISSVGGLLYPPWLSVYTASKSAVTTISETLRLEMAPLGVKVLTAVTGTVHSNFFVNGPQHKLPPTSRYVSVEKSIVARAQGRDIQSGMNAAKYADRVVDDVLRGENGKIWRGKLASIVRYASTYLPTFVLDWLLLQQTGLDTFPTTRAKEAKLRI